MKRHLFLLLSILLLAQSAWGVSLGPYKKRINLAGTGSAETNYIAKVVVHRGYSAGDALTNGVFLDNRCNTDFSDIRFTDSTGTELTHYRASYGNHEVIYDNTRLGKHNIIASDGSIYSTQTYGKGSGLYRSTDNGNTWTQLYSGTITLIFIDSRGYIYGSNSNLIIRSTNGGTSFSTVYACDVGQYLQWYAMDEDSSGNLYAGLYQASNGVKIIRSTDGGENWSSVSSIGTSRHVHGLAVDPYTDYIYAGIDGLTTNMGILRSTDGGTNWSFVYTGAGGDVTQMVFGDGWRLFGSGADGLFKGSSILRTTDDSTFTNVLLTTQSIQGLRKLGSNIYAIGVAAGKTKRPAIYKSTDNGATWATIRVEEHDPNTNYEFTGWECIHNVGTPTGGGEQLILGAYNDTVAYPHARLFDGGDHYEATFYVKIPTLPSNGGAIYVHYGNSAATTASTVATFPVEIPTTNLLLWVKFNEGTGTPADSSSNTWAITQSGGAWNAAASEGRQAGIWYPSIKQSAYSYYYDGAGRIEVTASTTDPAWQFVKNFTLSAWIRSTNSGGEQWIIGKGAGTTRWGLITSGQLYFYNNSTAINSSTGIIVTDGKWHMVSAVIDNSTPANIKFYVDGELVSAKAFASDITTNTLAVRSGRDTTGSKSMTGDVDDLRVYSTALTDSQIRQIYESRVFANTEPSIQGIVRMNNQGNSFSNMNFNLGW